MSPIEPTYESWDLPDTVYYVQSPHDTTVAVAMDVQVNHVIQNELEQGNVEWFDTVRQRKIAYDTVIPTQDGSFAVKRSDGRHAGDVYVFSEMTLEAYETIKGRTISSDQVFKSQADLIKAFQETRTGY